MASSAQAHVDHTRAVVGRQHVEALHPFHWPGEKHRAAPQAYTGPTPPPPPQAKGPGPRGPPAHLPGVCGHEALDAPTLVTSPCPRLSYAQVFLNMAFFLSFRRITVCAWHPCDLGGRQEPFVASFCGTFQLGSGPVPQLRKPSKHPLSTRGPVYCAGLSQNQALNFRGRTGFRAAGTIPIRFPDDPGSALPHTPSPCWMGRWPRLFVSRAL